MIFSQRAVLTSLTIVLVYGGFGFSCPQWTADLGLALWNYADGRQDARRKAEINEKDMRVRQQISISILIARDLVSKRIDLAEAAEQFLDLNKAEPEMLTDARRQFPAANDVESVAVQVIKFARVELDRDPSLCREVVGDLEQQLQEMRGCGPTVR